MEIGDQIPALAEACGEIVARNGLRECYIRPMVVRGYGSAGLSPVGSTLDLYVACWPWGTYLGEGALENGVDVKVSSWQRQEPNTFPSGAKAAGNYLNSQLGRLEAIEDGYADAIALGPGGLVSEGTGQNVFLVRDGALITPALDGTNLNGITRDSIITLAADAGHSRARAGGAARVAVHGRRAVLYRHGQRGHPHPQRGPHPGGRGHDGSRHPPAAAALPGHRPRPRAGRARLADARAGAGGGVSAAGDR